MAPMRSRSPVLAERIWTEEEKAEWLAEHGHEATHLVAFEPIYQLEICIPPWEDADLHITRSAQAWGRFMSLVFEEEPLGTARVVAAHHEGNALEGYSRVRARPRVRLV